MVNDHKFGKKGQTVFVAKGGAVWARKEGQNPKGGLNQKGRDAYTPLYLKNAYHHYI